MSASTPPTLDRRLEPTYPGPLLDKNFACASSVCASAWHRDVGRARNHEPFGLRGQRVRVWRASVHDPAQIINSKHADSALPGAFRVSIRPNPPKSTASWKNRRCQPGPMHPCAQARKGCVCGTFDRPLRCLSADSGASSSVSAQRTRQGRMDRLVFDKRTAVCGAKIHCRFISGDSQSTDTSSGVVP